MTAKHRAHPKRCPIIMYANYAELTPDFRLLNPDVWSRMLLWCRYGSGRIRVNDSAWIDFAAGQFAWLPWGHRIVYHAGAQEWHLGGIHIVPAYPVDEEPGWRVHHMSTVWEDDMARHADAPLAGLDGPMRLGSFHDVPELEHLAEYVVGWFRREPRSAAMARDLAGTVFDAVRVALSQHADAEAWPVSLRLMLAYIRDHLAEPIGVPELAHAGQCSAATVSRQFQRHLHFSPMLWLQRERMNRAAEWLRATPLRVGEIAVRVGVPDPYYFSRLFRQWQGMSPTEYRRGSAFLL